MHLLPCRPPFFHAGSPFASAEKNNHANKEKNNRHKEKKTLEAP